MKSILQQFYSKRLVLTLFISLALAILFYNCLPKNLFNAPVSSILLSEKGKLLGAHIAKDGQWRFPPLSTKQVPDKFKTSIIAFEDKRFYQHFGLDPLAIARAIKLNIQAGRIVSGGSTLSMQVIRLASDNPKRTFSEKLLEAIRALRLETRLSKDEILSLYASYAPFGGNVVGLEAASWRYFGRNPKQLSWAESAMLAVLPNSPGLIHPGRKRDSLKRKRDALLKKLQSLEHISELDYELAIAEMLPEKPKALPRLAPHLLDTLSLQSSDKTKRFITTLDHSIQDQVNEIAKHHAETLALKDIHNLSILLIDNTSFKVKAYIGNTPPKNTVLKNGQAIDLIQRPRSTGSTLKPFLFASMIEHGEILPETLIADAPIRYTGYKPKNFDRKYRGAVRAKQALASSLNIPAVNMLSYHGVERFLSSLRQLGLTTLHRRSREYGLPLILGGAESSLWELTNLYANLANQANKPNAAKNNNKQRQAITIKEQNTNTDRENIYSPATAWMTLNALIEVGRPGNEAYWKRFDSTHKIAWKTGTSFGHRDAWAIGTTPKYTVGVWVGNAAGEGRQGMTGVKVAAPILFDTFNLLKTDSHWFEKPLKQMKRVSICKDDGFLANDLCQAIPYDIPLKSHFDRVTPNHQRVHLDRSQHAENKAVRVHSNCESISNMQHQDWFVLPPEQAYYYQQFHADYKVLPQWRDDCLLVKTEKEEKQQSPISVIYPRSNTQVYIPMDLAHKRGKTVFQAIHSEPETKLYWHLNEDYIGTTKTYHEQAIWIAAGKHTLTLVDENGNRVEQAFNVLSK